MCREKRKKKTWLLHSIVLSQGLIILHTDPVAWLEICCTYKQQCNGRHIFLQTNKENEVNTAF